jgi:hypothetical protein
LDFLFGDSTPCSDARGTLVGVIGLTGVLGPLGEGVEMRDVEELLHDSDGDDARRRGGLRMDSSHSSSTSSSMTTMSRSSSAGGRPRTPAVEWLSMVSMTPETLLEERMERTTRALTFSDELVDERVIVDGIGVVLGRACRRRKPSIDDAGVGPSRAKLILSSPV